LNCNILGTVPKCNILDYTLDVETGIMTGAWFVRMVYLDE